MKYILDSFFNRHKIPQDRIVLIGSGAECDVRIEHPALDAAHFSYNPKRNDLTALSDKIATVWFWRSLKRVTIERELSCERTNTITLPAISPEEMIFIDIGKMPWKIFLTFQDEYTYKTSPPNPAGVPYRT